jgi:hypothetical protein
MGLQKRGWENDSAHDVSGETAHSLETAFLFGLYGDEKFSDG